jgi:S-adenosylmethionine synthetase
MNSKSGQYTHVATSESVTEGHPDKICDQVSDAILDAFLALDPNARVACETLAAGNMISIYGEVTSTANVDIEPLVKSVVREIGYTDLEYGLDADSCEVRVEFRPQTPEIAQAVTHDVTVDPFDAIGAGDQGLMFGYATNETRTLMPLPLDLAHHLARRLAWVRKNGILPYLRPDGKTQVTVGYDAAGLPAGILAVVVSAQHDPGITIEQIRGDLRREVVDPVIPAALVCPETIYYLNPAGSFTVGGPTGDTGLTGRKIIVDTYGGAAHHGGGCFSGKDPTKVDRSGAYAARQAAKWIVANGYAGRAEVSVGYAIGVAVPLAIDVETFGTGHSALSDVELSARIASTFDLRPAAIIARLNLRQPLYRQVAAYGHFGRDDLDLPWERIE